MSYTLSTRSLERLKDVNESLVNIVKAAIKKTKIDFGVTCGLRTKSEQAELVKKGASKTMNSRHLRQESTGTSHAVDLVAYISGRVSWELNLYDDIADAIKDAAIKEGKLIRWGAAWHKPLNEWDGSAEDLMNQYIDLRRSEGRRPFIDAPHFELV
tara:strand:+ start:5413 stop:5880 length:468 start_codon:yes stop_codon:yes gene_type:complete